MARTLILTAYPWQVAHAYQGELQVVTPSPGAAQSLSVAHLPLHSLPKTSGASEYQIEAALRHALHLHPLAAPRPALLELLSELTTLQPDHRTTLLEHQSSLAAVYAAFHSRLLEEGWRHPSDLTIEPEHQRPLLVYGFTALSTDQLKLLDVACLDGSVIVLPQANASFLASNQTAAQFLEARGWTVDVQTDRAAPGSPGEALAARFAYGEREAVLAASIRAHMARDRFDEVRQAIKAIRGCMVGDVLPSAAVVVSDPREYAGALRALAWEYDLPLHIKMQRRINESRLGAWLGEVFQTLIGDWSFERVLTLLSHPFTGGLPASVLRIAHQRRPASQAAWADLGLPRFLGGWHKEASAHEFAEQLLQHLDELNADALSEQDYDVGTTLIDLLAEAPHGGPIPLQTFAALALRALEEPLPEPEHDHPVVTVLTPEDARGARYDHVFILGLSEGGLPAPLSEPPLLDLYERRRFRAMGLPVQTARDLVHARERDFWSALAAAVTSVTLSYPMHAQNRPQSPSPYFKRLGLTPQPAALGQALNSEERLAQNLLSEEVDTAGRLSAQRALEAELNRQLGIPGAYTGLTARPRDAALHSFSATQLTRFGQCPYRWYAQHILGLQEAAGSDTELLPHERGELYHRVLELAVTGTEHSQDPRIAIQENLDRAFTRAAQELGLSRRAAWGRQAGEHLERLRQTVRDETFLPDGRHVLAAELKFDVQWHGLRVTGQIDRIDRTAEGQIVVTDYKSSSSKPRGAKDSTGRAKLDVQLPLYLEVAAQLHPEAQGVTGSYLSLTRRENRTLGKAALDPGALDPLADQLKAMTAAGHYPAEPDVEGHACTYCAYRTLCRRRDDTGEEK